MTAASTLLILSATLAAEPVRSALCASAAKLGHGVAPCFISLSETSDLELLVHEADPWSVVAIDDASIDALRAAFVEAEGFAADHPVTVRGYTLVAVPGFAACLEDQAAKRIAWDRLQAAAHPKAPW